MDSFGDKLKQVREAKRATIEQVAQATGIDPGYLEALEKNDFEALPGPAFGKLYIREYAEVLQFDPRALIEEYDRERLRRRPAPVGPARAEPERARPVQAALEEWRRKKIQEREGPPPEVEPIDLEAPAQQDLHSPTAPIEPGIAPPPEPVAIAHAEDAAAGSTSRSGSRAGRPRRGAMLAGTFVLALLVVVTILSTRNRDAEPVAPAIVRQPPPPPVASAPPPARVDLPPAPPPPSKPRPTQAASAARPLAVSEFGVGRRIETGALEDPTDTFATGDVAYFSTRVLGGTRGGRVRHVWILEGKVQQTIPLVLGGPSWHTYSSKTLRSTGQWAVEARDHEGRVLARATFTCS